LQDAKEFFMTGVSTTRGCLRVLSPFVETIQVNKRALKAGFSPDVFATDRALELVGEGMPFRDAYNYVKENLAELEKMDPAKALAKKTHLGAPMGIDWTLLKERLAAVKGIVGDERKFIAQAMEKLFSTK